MLHNCLGHPNSHVLNTLLKSGSLGNKKKFVPFDCITCKLGKSKVLPFPNNASRATHCFDIIHSDVWWMCLPNFFYMLCKLMVLYCMVQNPCISNA